MIEYLGIRTWSSRLRPATSLTRICGRRRRRLSASPSKEGDGSSQLGGRALGERSENSALR
jgi:hypothetical protein